MTKSFYFQHDYNAANDHKILFLRQQLGIEGYGIYWYVIEQLAQSDGQLPIKIIPVLAMQIGTTQDKVLAVVKNYELFDFLDELFFSARLLKQIKWRKDLSEQGRIGGQKSAEIRRIEGGLEPGFKQNPTKGKERKGKELNLQEDIDRRRQVFYQKLVPHIPSFGKVFLREFYDYWTEIGDNQRKMRFEKESTFELAKRLARWKKNDDLKKKVVVTPSSEIKSSDTALKNIERFSFDTEPSKSIK